MRKLVSVLFIFSVCFATVPSEMFRWATGPNATNIRPLDSRISNGWFPGEKPAAQHFNYLFNSIGGWIEYLNDGWPALAFSEPIVLTGLEVVSNGTNTVTVSSGAALIRGRVYWHSNISTNTIVLAGSGSNRNATVAIGTNGIEIFYGASIATGTSLSGVIPETGDFYRPIANLVTSAVSITSLTTNRMQGVLIKGKGLERPSWSYTLSYALSNAMSFSVIDVRPGDYRENAVLTGKTDVTINANRAAIIQGRSGDLLKFTGCTNVLIVGGQATGLLGYPVAVVSGSAIRFEGSYISNATPSVASVVASNSVNLGFTGCDFFSTGGPLTEVNNTGTKGHGCFYNGSRIADFQERNFMVLTNAIQSNIFYLLDSAFSAVGRKYNLTGNLSGTNSSGVIYAGVFFEAVRINSDTIKLYDNRVADGSIPKVGGYVVEKNSTNRLTLNGPLDQQLYLTW